jgi:hypothetical protein
MADGFNCPHCGAFAEQRWGAAAWRTVVSGPAFPIAESHRFSRCTRCEKFAVWIDARLVHPRIVGGPAPNADLPADASADFEEARRILEDSPRGAAALLRLVIQKLCVHLELPGKDLNKDIAALVARGLPAPIQQALDIVRVVGNNAVHPGQIDLRDDKATATTMFELVNAITNAMITQPKAIKELYDSLPKTALQAIDDRDGRS